VTVNHELSPPGSPLKLRFNKEGVGRVIIYNESWELGQDDKEFNATGPELVMGHVFLGGVGWVIFFAFMATSDAMESRRS
jgi:hypothetical protein